MSGIDWLVLATTIGVVASLALMFGWILNDVLRDLAEAQRDGSA